MIKNVAAAAALLLALLVAGQPAHAGEFSVRRGLNLDIWMTWPPETRWGERDVILPFPEWRRTVGLEELRALRESGFDFVRIPVDPAPFLSPVAAPLRADLLAGVREAARLANEAGLKALIDIHSIPRGDSPTGTEGILGSEEAFEPFLALVRDVARTLSDADPALVALEVMNEPIIDCEDGEARWPDMLGRLFAAARASATQLTLVLPGACWSSAEGLAALDPSIIPDDNVIWTFHSYQPFLLTHQGAEWAGDFIRYVTGLTYPLHAMPPAEREAAGEAIRTRIRAEAPWHRRAGMLAYLDEQIAGIDTAEELQATMEEPFRLVSDWAAKHGIAAENVLLGEFGMIRQEYENPAIVPAASRAAYVRDMIHLAEKRGFAWSIWGYGGAFGVVEEFGGRPAEPDILDVVHGLD